MSNFELILEPDPVEVVVVEGDDVEVLPVTGDTEVVVADFAPEPVIEIELGVVGPEGPGFIWRGAYDGGTAYTENDVVSFSGRTYVNILASQGDAPSGTTASNTWWDLFVDKGSQGDEGPQGEAGPLAYGWLTGGL